MAKSPENRSFGSMLHSFRKRTVDRDWGRPLSQGQLADILNKVEGLFTTRNQISNWESGRSTLDARDDRPLLIHIVGVLYKYHGIRTPEDTNELLDAGGFRTLTPDEIDELNHTWHISIPHSKAPPEAGPVLAPTLALPKELNVSIHEPLSVRLLAAQAGPGSAPPVPSLIIGRDDDISSLKNSLGVGQEIGPRAAIQILTAIKGWPGVGKTTIASALAYDPEIRDAYPDGVLWVSLGQEPNLLSEIAAWGRALGADEMLHARTIEEAQAQLAALLLERRMLLIIDDVWKAEHAVPFKVGGRGCATLITTRRDDVANALAPTAASIYRLKVLSDEAGLALLRELAPTVVASHKQNCMVLVHELEGLPLALQVAGRLLNTEANRGFGVTDLIIELRQGAKLLEAEAPADRVDLVSETTPTIAALLQKSLDHLEDHTRDCYAYLGVFAPKPATFDLEAMKSIWQVDDPQQVVKELIDRGLLEFVPQMERYQMHAILVMLAKSLLT